MSVTYISWAPHCSRSDNTARELAGRSHMVYWAGLGSRAATVWLKYAGQALATWRILIRERPEAVFVMAPPLFAILSVWMYCCLCRCPFVIDAHTAAFLHPRWKRFQWLQSWLCRRAATTFVTNEHLAQIVVAARGHATIVPDVPVVFPPGDPFPLGPGFNVAIVCSFNPDEPIEAILAAAALVPEVRFHMTGEGNRHDIVGRLPKNVKLTGFLSTAAYGSLLQQAQGVMTLTTRNHTMLRGAWESIYQGTPVIVSDWPVLRDAFAKGAVHVDNTPSGIAEGIGRLRLSYEDYRRDAAALRAEKQARWNGTKAALRDRLKLG